MFTIFLTAIAAAVSLLLIGLLLRPKTDTEPLHIPLAGAAVAVTTMGLVALGFWMI